MKLSQIRLSLIKAIAASGSLLLLAISLPTSAQTGCLTWQTVKQSNGQQLVLNADNWGQGTACLTNTSSAANYSIASQTQTYTGNVLAYPNINVGDAGGYCSTGSQLPLTESTAKPQVTWTTTNKSATGSKFDTGIDSWFASSATEGCNPTATGEVGIFINSSNFTAIGLPHSGKQVTIDGHKWYVLYNKASSKRAWPYTQYALAQGSVINKVSAFSLQPFYANTIANHNLSTGQYLTNIGAGNEIWTGGTGLSTTSISFSNL